MKNDTDLPQSVTILEHVQKPTKQRFFVLPVLRNAKRVCKCLSSIGISITTSANHNVLS